MTITRLQPFEIAWPLIAHRYVAMSRTQRLDQLHVHRPLRLEDVLVQRRALAFLVEGDTPTTLEEVRAKATDVYQQTRKLRDRVEAKRFAMASERAELELMMREARQTLAATREVAGETRRLAAQVADKVSEALEIARRAHWLRRLLGRFLVRKS